MERNIIYGHTLKSSIIKIKQKQKKLRFDQLAQVYGLPIRGLIIFAPS